MTEEEERLAGARELGDDVVAVEDADRPPSASSSSAIRAATCRTPGEYVGDSISTSSRRRVRRLGRHASLFLTATQAWAGSKSASQRASSACELVARPAVGGDGVDVRPVVGEPPLELGDRLLAALDLRLEL